MICEGEMIDTRGIVGPERGGGGERGEITPYPQIPDLGKSGPLLTRGGGSTWNSSDWEFEEMESFYFYGRTHFIRTPVFVTSWQSISLKKIIKSVQYTSQIQYDQSIH